jgi:hypothetical protein
MTSKRYHSAGAKFRFEGEKEWTTIEPVDPLDIGFMNRPGTTGYIEAAVMAVDGVESVKVVDPMEGKRPGDGWFSVYVKLIPGFTHEEALDIKAWCEQAVEESKAAAICFDLFIENMPEQVDPPSRSPELDWGWY